MVVKKKEPEGREGSHGRKVTLGPPLWLRNQPGLGDAFASTDKMGLVAVKILKLKIDKG